MRERSTAVRGGPANACYVVSRVEGANPTGDDPLERRSRLMSKLDLGHLSEVIRFAIDHGLAETL